MTPLPIELPAWHALLLAAPAMLAAFAALVASPSRGVAGAWRTVHVAASLALGAAVVSLLAVMAGAGGVGFGLRADATGGIVLMLATFVGWTIVRYSRVYLAGQRRETHYVRWLAATLAAVAAVPVADHLALLAAAWTATSLALHRLLTFFDDRPAAVIAAHKKFLAARAADACMLAALVLLAFAHGTLSLDALWRDAVAADALPAASAVAVVLIALAAVLRCAQLPFHGWLIQVMEAPTPVSALLHAGIVNLGGFVLIRVAPLVSEVPAAQVLLVVAGTVTAVIAALVMTTRISVKVMLAWSTCAQMGFMLMQCGLGLWEMALLHLVAHSLYKAHAFLAAGGAVREATLARMAPVETPPGLGGLLAGLAIGVAATAAAALAWSPGLHASASLIVLGGIVAVALAPLSRPRAGGDAAWLALNALGAFVVALAWFGLHAALAGRIAPDAPPASPPLWIVVAAGFAILFAVQCAVQIAPRGRLALRLYPWLYGGLFLDERLSRAAFALWPVPSPAPRVDPTMPSAARPTSTVPSSGAQA